MMVTYWANQKVHLGFPISRYGTIRTNFLANPIHTYCGEICLMKLQLHLEMHLDVFFLQQHWFIYNVFDSYSMKVGILPESIFSICRK